MLRVVKIIGTAIETLWPIEEREEMGVILSNRYKFQFYKMKSYKAR